MLRGSRLLRPPQQFVPRLLTRAHAARSFSSCMQPAMLPTRAELPLAEVLAASLSGALLIHACSAEEPALADSAPRKMDAAAQFDAARSLSGVWVQDMNISESMAPFLQGYADLLQ